MTTYIPYGYSDSKLQSTIDLEGIEVLKYGVVTSSLHNIITTLKKVALFEGDSTTQNLVEIC
ncbi:MAG: hypothetical protein ACQ9ET_05445 [Nitrosomonadaceae bacterium]